MDSETIEHIDRMRQASRHTVWTLGERLERLRTLQRMQRENREILVAAIEADFGGRGKPWSTVVDIGGGLNTTREVITNLAQWMKPQRVDAAIPFNLAGDAYCIYEPLGVILCLTPWNFPVHLATSALADLIGAGNRVVLKPSEHAPRTSKLLAELVAKYFDPLDIYVICGDAKIAQTLTSLKFDHIMFTGSPSVGKIVMRAAAENLTPVTLELGGKNPVLVAPDYDLEHAARELINFKAGNVGQMCTCVDYVLVPEGRAGDFADFCADEVSKRWGQDKPLTDHPEYSSMININHANRVKSLILDAQQKGGAVRCLCPKGKQQNGNKIALTLVLPPLAPEMKVLTEEVFGPVMAIREYKDITSAISYINRGERPLAFYAFTNSTRTRQLLLERIVAGGITINALNVHAVVQALPFGGVGNSGMGAYHGIDGFHNFSHKKSIYVAKRSFLLPNILPPFSKFDLRVIEMALKDPPPFKKIVYVIGVLLFLYLVYRRDRLSVIFK